MDARNFLLELGCEELPSSEMQSLASHLVTQMSKQFDAANLAFSNIRPFISPRRMAVLVESLATRQPNQTTERKGPSLDKAYDKTGAPTIACLGFAKSCNASLDELYPKETKQGTYIHCTVKKTGQTTDKLLAGLVEEALKKIPLRKSMRWGNNDFDFVRPVQWVVMLFSNELIPATLFNLKTTRETQGHRFHNPAPIYLKQARDYEDVLKLQGHVIADFNNRKNNIAKQIEKKVAKNKRAVMDEKLLDEVTTLVEWPVVLIGSFPTRFLEIPREVLITTMQYHQKCFAVENDVGELQPNFVMVSNLESRDPEQVIKGNERVINARLSDADFFYQVDCKTPLTEMSKGLQKLIFQKELGSLADKTKRLEKLGGFIAEQLSANMEEAKCVASLCKNDLCSQMVREFPELQGTMGYYYALVANESGAVATAIKEQYLPRFAKDALPSSAQGNVIALADRIDTLVGIFGINRAPTGDKDPFGLRRAAIGVIRLLIENQLPLNLRKLLEAALQNYAVTLPNEHTVTQCMEFILERLRAWYLDQGIAHDTFAAVLATQPSTLTDFAKRILAVKSFRQLPEAQSLAQANKRVSQILKKQGALKQNTVELSYLQEAAEQTLHTALMNLQNTVKAHCQEQNYQAALTELATLKQPIDDFFDNVMVMADDEKLKQNRLALLQELRSLFTQVADISVLQI